MPVFRHMGARQISRHEVPPVELHSGLDGAEHVTVQTFAEALLQFLGSHDAAIEILRTQRADHGGQLCSIINEELARPTQRARHAVVGIGRLNG
jgi:hypothetical protein